MERQRKRSLKELKAQYGSKVGSVRIIWLHKEAEPQNERLLVHDLVEIDCFPERHDEYIGLEGTQHGPSSLTVMFPPSRPPLNLRLERSHDGHVVEESVPDDELRDEGQRKVYRLTRSKMKRGEEYRPKWD